MRSKDYKRHERVVRRVVSIKMADKIDEKFQVLRTNRDSLRLAQLSHTSHRDL